MRQEERQGVKNKEKTGCVAAFFDLDGTLVAGPSLQRRFFHELQCRRVIGPKNYLWWLAQALRLAPRGIRAILQGNKMYLRGVVVTGRERNPGQGMRQAFFAAAIERVGWHAERGDKIVILSGTLELLALAAARELELILTQRGIAAKA